MTLIFIKPVRLRDQSLEGGMDHPLNMNKHHVIYFGLIKLVFLYRYIHEHFLLFPIFLFKIFSVIHYSFTKLHIPCDRGHCETYDHENDQSYFFRCKLMSTISKKTLVWSRGIGLTYIEPKIGIWRK